MNYKESGVDVEKNTKLVSEIRQISNISVGFADFKPLEGHKYLHQSTDGVGTKIKLAYKYDMTNIGQDLVAMCANDIIASGATPYYFQDYIGQNSLDKTIIRTVIKSINRACNNHNIKLTGGEMAEMPDTYKYDYPELVGFCTGFSNYPFFTNEIVAPGDTIVAFPSTGPHSNGFSLINKIFDTHQDQLERYVYDLLQPTRIYSEIASFYDKNPNDIVSMSHITGGGLIENLERSIPHDLSIDIDYNSWTVPSVFNLIQEYGDVPKDDMWKTFNMGVGFCVISNNPRILLETFPDAWRLGTIY